MPYEVVVEASARRDMLRVPEATLPRIKKAIKGLSTNPRPAGCVKLRQKRGSYRIRVGEYRILYSVRDRVLTVLVLKVAHRREVYDR